MDYSVNHLKLKVLFGISRIIDQTLYLDQALADTLRILSENLSMKRAAVVLEDLETGHLVISAAHGLTSEEAKRGVYSLGEGITGRVFQSGAPYYVPDIRKEPHFLDRTGARQIEKGPISFIGVPIVLNGRPIGVLHVDRLFGENTDFQEDMEFLGVVATLIAQFISLNKQVRDRVRHLKRQNVSLRYRLSRSIPGRYIVGQSQAMLDVQRQVEKVAPTRATVLLLGESGTGKTLIARIIHDLSDRKDYPFVKVNCAAIPENLLESELFGYEKGAFTGAGTAKAGRFEDAEGGTVFLDEIGELPLGLQSKLLRILQEKEFERLGGHETRKVNVRIIAATNRDITALVDRGHFREDLFYRLNVFPIFVPPLRERKEDLERLLNHFLKKVSEAYQRRLHFTTAALDCLKEHEWPGNVREMENLIERLVILAEGEKIDRTLIEPYLHKSPKHQGSPPKVRAGANAPAATGGPNTLKHLEIHQIMSSLRRNNWIQSQACRELGLTLRQLGYRLRKYQLKNLVAEERAKSRSAREF